MNFIIETFEVIKKNVYLNVLIFIFITSIICTFNYISSKKNIIDLNSTADLKILGVLTDNVYQKSNIQFDQIAENILSKTRNDLTNIILSGNISSFRIEPNNVDNFISNKKFSIIIEHDNVQDIEKLISRLSKNINQNSRDIIHQTLEIRRLSLQSYLEKDIALTQILDVFEDPRYILSHINFLLNFNDQNNLFSIEYKIIQKQFFDTLFFILIFFGLVISTLITTTLIYLKKELNAN